MQRAVNNMWAREERWLMNRPSESAGRHGCAWTTIPIRSSFKTVYYHYLSSGIIISRIYHRSFFFFFLFQLNTERFLLFLPFNFALFQSFKRCVNTSGETQYYASTMSHRIKSFKASFLLVFTNVEILTFYLLLEKYFI